MKSRPITAFFAATAISVCLLNAQPANRITTPKEALGFNLGDDYMVANYTQLEAYWKKLATEIRPHEAGRASARPKKAATSTWRSSPRRRTSRTWRSTRRSRATGARRGLTEEQAHALAREGKAIVWIDGGLHASETVGSQQLMEMVYQMVSRTDPETMRFLNDVILLCVQANPDGQELVANWYMRGKGRRSNAQRMNGLPRLYAKYVGHDDNRDFYMSNMKETTNMNRQLFIEWFPQIMYNHHQTGPAGAVIFMPPFRDPFNYNFDPLVPLGIEMVGTAMHSRLVAEGKGGSAMRTRRQLLHLVERRPAHHHLLPQHDRHPDRDHRQPDADARSRWSPTSSCRRAIGRCRSRRRRGTTASRSITK